MALHPGHFGIATVALLTTVFAAVGCTDSASTLVPNQDLRPAAKTPHVQTDSEGRPKLLAAKAAKTSQVQNDSPGRPKKWLAARAGRLRDEIAVFQNTIRRACEERQLRDELMVWLARLDAIWLNFKMTESEYKNLAGADLSFKAEMEALKKERDVLQRQVEALPQAPLQRPQPHHEEPPSQFSLIPTRWDQQAYQLIPTQWN